MGVTVRKVTDSDHGDIYTDGISVPEAIIN